MEPKYVRPEMPVPTSWPVGDVYLKQSEAALPAFHLSRHLQGSAASDPDRSGAGQQSRPAGRRRQHHRGARAISHPARGPVPRGRCDRALFAVGAAAMACAIPRAAASTTRATGTSTGNTGTGTGTGTGSATGTGSTGTVTTTRFSSNSAFSHPPARRHGFELDLFFRVRSLSRAALDRYFATEARGAGDTADAGRDIADAG